VRSPGADARRLPLRSALAADAVGASNWLSRSLGRGSGTVAGGRVGLAIDPRLLERLAEGRWVALVTGTNGKTTTTRMLVAAIDDRVDRSPVSNRTGANMPAGHVAAMAGSRKDDPAVLEVDEGYLGQVVADTRPRVVVLLNLSRDQLDRISEVRMLVERWRAALGPGGERGQHASSRIVVANADDPMVAWAASTAPVVHWVGAGQVWRNDAVGCPACDGRIVFDADGEWACERCDYRRPCRDAWIDGTELVLADGTRHPVETGMPGQFNRSNAAMAAVAGALAAGADRGGPAWSPAVRRALGRIARVEEVAGRFSSVTRRGQEVRLLLAKNPAGWTAIFDLLDEEGPAATPVVLGVNARVADGLDTSWLWDVPFERLAGRGVVATGDRRVDLAVRLRYAEVGCTVVADPVAAVDRALDWALDRTEGPGPGSGIDFLGNYTAFADAGARL
jgi:lipid II isoglutaminyl synthase (glutamine-hydrolysing)